MPGIEPGPLTSARETVRPPYGEDNRPTSAHRKLGWPTGFAPAQAPSQGAMLLLHHGQHEMVLSRGLAPRTFSFARRNAELLHLESELNAERERRKAEWTFTNSP